MCTTYKGISTSNIYHTLFAVICSIILRHHVIALFMKWISRHSRSHRVSIVAILFLHIILNNNCRDRRMKCGTAVLNTRSQNNIYTYLLRRKSYSRLFECHSSHIFYHSTRRFSDFLLRSLARNCQAFYSVLCPTEQEPERF